MWSKHNRTKRSPLAVKFAELRVWTGHCQNKTSRPAKNVTSLGPTNTSRSRRPVRPVPFGLVWSSLADSGTVFSTARSAAAGEPVPSRSAVARGADQPSRSRAAQRRANRAAEPNRSAQRSRANSRRWAVGWGGERCVVELEHSRSG